MKFLFDTDHISILQRKSGPEYAAMSNRIAAHASVDFAFSIISFHEQVLGCHTYINRARDSASLEHGYHMLEKVYRDFAATPLAPFDSAAVAEFYRLQTQKLRIGTMDLRIGAIALSQNVVLLTRNTADFAKITGLQIEDWTI